MLAWPVRLSYRYLALSRSLSLSSSLFARLLFLSLSLMICRQDVGTGAEDVMQGRMNLASSVHSCARVGPHWCVALVS